MGSEMCIRDSRKSIPSIRIFETRHGIGNYCTNIRGVPNKTISAVQTNSKTTKSIRHELRQALSAAFNKTTFSPGECEQVLDLCTKYRNVFSLSPRELGKCTIAEAEFPLEPGTRPVDRAPYRTNPRLQETIDKCVNQMEQDGIIEQRLSPWGCLLYTSPSPRDGLLSRMPSSA